MFRASNAQSILAPASLRRTVVLLACAVLYSGCSPAGAQVPGLPELPPLPELGRTLPATGAADLTGELDTARRAVRIDALLRRNRARLEADPNGEPVRRGRIVAVEPTAAALATAAAAGFGIIEERRLDALGIRLIVLQPPPGQATPRALATLRRLDPGGSYDFDHVYTVSGSATAAGMLPAAAMTRPPPPAPEAAAPVRIGLVDAGIDVAHPALRPATIATWGCDDQRLASPHGTAVASLLVGRAQGFAGVVPDALLYAADVYCNDEAGGNVMQIVAALDWLLGQRVDIVNLSLVGAQNILLERAVRRAADAGIGIVAAVGNDGPDAPPLYPAAYPEVIAVTAVNGSNRALPEAGRGEHVEFAAPGADMVAATPDAGFVAVRGTSFAAPIVTGLLARDALTVADVAERRARLVLSATDLGRRGRDPVYGFGLVGTTYRIASVDP